MPGPESMLYDVEEKMKTFNRNISAYLEFLQTSGWLTRLYLTGQGQLGPCNISLEVTRMNKRKRVGHHVIHTVLSIYHIAYPCMCLVDIPGFLQIAEISSRDYDHCSFCKKFLVVQRPSFKQSLMAKKKTRQALFFARLWSNAAVTTFMPFPKFLLPFAP